MSKMTDYQIDACYRGGVLVYEGKTLLHRERDRIANETGMNEASASYYLSAVYALLSDGDIHYYINSKAVDSYLEKIYSDYGIDALRRAADVCFRRYETTKSFNKTCHYYKRIANDHLKRHSLRSSHE